MCFGDNGAKKQQAIAAKTDKQMRLAEDQRQADIAQGKTNIDSAFGRFDDNYYDQFKNDYTGYYNPQIDEQYGRASGKLVAALAGRGIDESTVGADQNAQLYKKYVDTKAGVGNEAVDAANALRGNVEKTKTSLYGLNQASADPAGINARAMGEATSLVAPASYNPLGQVFAAGLEPWVGYAKNKAAGPGARYQSPYTLPSGQGSGSVVR